MRTAVSAWSPWYGNTSQAGVLSRAVLDETVVLHREGSDLPSRRNSSSFNNAIQREDTGHCQLPKKAKQRRKIYMYTELLAFICATALPQQYHLGLKKVKIKHREWGRSSAAPDAPISWPTSLTTVLQKASFSVDKAHYTGWTKLKWIYYGLQFRHQIYCLENLFSWGLIWGSLRKRPKSYFLATLNIVV